MATKQTDNSTIYQPSNTLDQLAYNFASQPVQPTGPDNSAIIPGMGVNVTPPNKSAVFGNYLHDLGMRHVQMQQQQKDQNFLKNVHDVMTRATSNNSDGTPLMTREDAIQHLIDLNAQHGGGYLDDTIKQLGDLNKQNDTVPTFTVDPITGQPKVTGKISKDAKDVTGSSFKFQEQQDQFNQKEWDKISKDANPLNASPRTALGKASVANYNANRALKTLENPMVTNQEAGNVMADIASIYQGGAPTEFGMSHQQYDTLQSKIAGTMQYFKGQPQNALTPDIKQRLIGVLQDMKKTNNEVLRQQLDYVYKSKKKVIDKFPQEWNDMKNTLLTDQYSGLQNQQQLPSVPKLTATNPQNGQRIQSLDGGQTWQPAQ